MHIYTSTWIPDITKLMSKTELEIHPQPTLLLPTILSMALFLPSAASPNPQQTPLSLSLKYGLNLPTFLYCHYHHPNISHKFLLGYLPIPPCFLPSIPYSSLFAEKPKQSFKSKSGHLFPTSRPLPAALCSPSVKPNPLQQLHSSYLCQPLLLYT